MSAYLHKGMYLREIYHAAWIFGYTKRRTVEFKKQHPQITSVCLQMRRLGYGGGVGLAICFADEASGKGLGVCVYVCMCG